MLLLTGGATWWLLKSALRPVVEMTEQAAAWSEFDLDRRFGRGKPHDELTLLAGTLDVMLDRIAASLRHERRFSAELSHELRTPLARLRAEVELALRRAGRISRATLELALRNAQQLTRIVETLFAAAQHEVTGAHGTADAYAVATDAIGAVTPVGTRAPRESRRGPGRLRLYGSGSTATSPSAFSSPLSRMPAATAPPGRASA